MATEDLTTYTEVDAGNDITVTIPKADVVAMPCNVVSYVSGDKGVGHFGDFEHQFTVHLGTATADVAHAVFWALTNGAHTVAAMAGDDRGGRHHGTVR